MSVDNNFEANVLRIAAERHNEPIFYRYFDSICPIGVVGGHWLHNVKRILIENGYRVHERKHKITWTYCNCESSYTHFHQRVVDQDKQDELETERARLMSDSLFLHTAIVELRQLYKEFPLEPVIWKRDGLRRDPYKTLIVMGFSQRVSDSKGIPVWRSFLAKYPTTADLRKSWRQDRAQVTAIIRPLGFPGKFEQIIEAAIGFGDSIPSDKDQLIIHPGIGETIAEKIVGYGYGKPALPFDGQAQRVISKLTGRSSENGPHLRTKLKDMFPREAWMEVHELLRLHGQAICKKREPLCTHCPVSRCNSRSADWSDSFAQAQFVARGVIYSWEKWRQLLVSSQDAVGERKTG